MSRGAELLRIEIKKSEAGHKKKRLKAEGRKRDGRSGMGNGDGQILIWKTGKQEQVTEKMTKNQQPDPQPLDPE
jgi:hypothetical protein